MNRNNDINGKESSKRFWANRFFTLGFYMAIGMFLFWMYSHLFVEKDFHIPMELIEIWKWLMGFASVVIIGTVFEKKI